MLIVSHTLTSRILGLLQLSDKSNNSVVYYLQIIGLRFAYFSSILALDTSSKFIAVKLVGA